MPADLKLLIRKLALFFLPFVLFGTVIAFIDPYGLVGGPTPFPSSDKESISLPLNYPMWKMVAFRRKPVSNILLGDSRMMSVDPEVIEEVSGQEFFNFAYGGGSLREAIDTFWFAAGRTRLDKACFGINLNNYSSYDNKDRVTEVSAILDNPLLYLVNLNVLDASWKLVWSRVSGNPVRIGRPPESREQFWRHQIDVVTREMLTNYRYPTEYHGKLMEIRDYCLEEGIALSFLVFPGHRELQDQVKIHGLEDAQARMLKDLAGLGRVYNFDLENEITADRGNYTDPYHFDRKVMRTIVEGAWGKGNGFVEVLGD